MWAVVPLKNIRHAKQRLAPLLTPAERSELMLAMVTDVLTALTQTPGLAGILLVSRAPEAAELAHAFTAANCMPRPTARTSPNRFRPPADIWLRTATPRER